MKKRRYVARDEGIANVGDPHALPTDRPIAVYYRQSRGEQVGNLSTAFQIEDLPAYVRHLGWSNDDIILIDDDAGISGMTRIHDRPGMGKLFNLILRSEIGAVACQDEDRLFRDLTQIQVNLFIQACREADVRVITPSMVYNFRHELCGSFHARQFRFKAEQATEFIYALTQGRIFAAKQRLIMQGIWVGGSIPVGFILDDRKTLPDGSANAHWHKFVPFDPYAHVISAYYHLFLEHGGVIGETVAHICHHGPYYPDFDDPEIVRQVPDGFLLRKPNAIRKSGGLYYPGCHTLPNLLTHAAYIGHWVHKDRIVKWRNHPAIVPDDLFFEAFNYLSNTTLDGEPNPAFHPAHPPRRWASTAMSNAARPLCEGLIVSYCQGHPVPVRVYWDPSYQDYKYVFPQWSSNQSIQWQKKAIYVDEAVSHLLRAKLRNAFESSVWEKAMQSERGALELRRSALSQRVAALERRMDDIVEELAVDIHGTTLEQTQAAYEAYRVERDQLSGALQEEGPRRGLLASLHSFRDTYHMIPDKWDELEHARQRAVLKTFVGTIIATRAGKGILQLAITWRDGTSDTILLSHQAIDQKNTCRTFWLKSEIQTLESMIERQATQVEMMATFPHRPWASIREVARVQLGTALIVSPKPILDHETYQDYLGRMKDRTAPYRARSGQRWSPDDLKLLQSLVEANQTKRELAEAFPHRTWSAIRRIITRLYGKTRRVPGTDPIRREETITMYQARMEHESAEERESPRRIERDAPDSIRPFDPLALFTDSESAVHQTLSLPPGS